MSLILKQFLVFQINLCYPVSGQLSLIKKIDIFINFKQLEKIND